MVQLLLLFISSCLSSLLPYDESLGSMTEDENESYIKQKEFISCLVTQFNYNDEHWKEYHSGMKRLNKKIFQYGSYHAKSTSNKLNSLENLKAFIKRVQSDDWDLFHLESGKKLHLLIPSNNMVMLEIIQLVGSELPAPVNILNEISNCLIHTRYMSVLNTPYYQHMRESLFPALADVSNAFDYTYAIFGNPIKHDSPDDRCIDLNDVEIETISVRGIDSTCETSIAWHNMDRDFLIRLRIIPDPIELDNNLIFIPMDIPIPAHDTILEHLMESSFKDRHLTLAKWQDIRDKLQEYRSIIAELTGIGAHEMGSNQFVVRVARSYRAILDFDAKSVIKTYSWGRNSLRTSGSERFKLTSMMIKSVKRQHPSLFEHLGNPLEDINVRLNRGIFLGMLIVLLAYKISKIITTTEYI